MSGEAPDQSAAIEFNKALGETCFGLHQYVEDNLAEGPRKAAVFRHLSAFVSAAEDAALYNGIKPFVEPEATDEGDAAGEAPDPYPGGAG
jgi:hypothetical protein